MMLVAFAAMLSALVAMSALVCVTRPSSAVMSSAFFSDGRLCSGRPGRLRPSGPSTSAGHPVGRRPSHPWRCRRFLPIASTSACPSSPPLLSLAIQQGINERIRRSCSSSQRPACRSQRLKLHLCFGASVQRLLRHPPRCRLSALGGLLRRVLCHDGLSAAASSDPRATVDRLTRGKSVGVGEGSPGHAFVAFNPGRRTPLS